MKTLVCGQRAALLTFIVAWVFCAGLSQTALAQDNPFAPGWTLQPASSTLNFQSVKNETKVESNGFATLSGAIDQNGTARVTIMLDSVDTKIDLRNVRMRFLFFESFNYPEAVIIVQLDPALLADLQQVRRKTIRLSYALNLHGVLKSFEAETVVTLLSDDLVSVSTNIPISVAAADFNLLGGVSKLEEAADVEIIPSATVTFDLMFARNSAEGTLAAANTSESTASKQPTQVTLEPEGDFDTTACKGRFEILSRAGNIYFRSGSARLDQKSAPLLNSLVDIISRCPNMVVEVGGHTDAIGSDAANLRLSEARAESVTTYLTSKGVGPDRLLSAGYGETRPVAENDTAENRRRNRRIEFTVVKG